jgi:hypothetical protein
VALINNLNATIQKVVVETNAEREKGNANWWRRLEATLASLGSVSESVMDCVNDEVDAGKPKPIDIEGLLANIIPPLLSLSGKPIPPRSFYVLVTHSRLPLPSGAGLCIRKSICETLPSRTRQSICRCCTARCRGSPSWRSSKSVRNQVHPKVQYL